MRILVCGGRDYLDITKVEEVLDQYCNIQTIIHGSARGADMCAHCYALSRKIPIEEYPADWEKYGKAAGPIRNKQMLDEGQPDLVIAFKGGKGTANMIKQTQERGIPLQCL